MKWTTPGYNPENFFLLNLLCNHKGPCIFQFLADNGMTPSGEYVNADQHKRCEGMDLQFQDKEQKGGDGSDNYENK